ncbi:hypothetical protein SDJN03_03898, partial [Cucurbita argyrosperma subsp. sororia]
MLQRHTKGPICKAATTKYRRKIDPYSLSAEGYIRENAWQELMCASIVEQRAIGVSNVQKRRNGVTNPNNQGKVQNQGQNKWGQGAPRKRYGCTMAKPTFSTKQKQVRL